MLGDDLHPEVAPLQHDRAVEADPHAGLRVREPDLLELDRERLLDSAEGELAVDGVLPFACLLDALADERGLGELDDVEDLEALQDDLALRRSGVDAVRR